jgi:hypothetical protein
VNMPHAKALIKEFKERRQKEAKAAAEAKADGKSRKSSKVKVPTLMKDNDIVLEDDNTTQRTQASEDGYKPNKRRKKGPIQIRR